MDEIISYKMCAVKVRNAKLRNYLNIKAGFFHRDVMPKGVFSIFKKDPLLIYDLVIFITVVYLIILLLLNNFEFVLRKQSNFRPNFYAVTYLVV
jgi:hypothetical protein